MREVLCRESSRTVSALRCEACAICEEMTIYQQNLLQTYQANNGCETPREYGIILCSLLSHSDPIFT